MKKLLAGVILATSTMFATAPMAYAEYPEKPVEVIVPYGAGGSTDVLARLVAKYAEKYLGQPMVVVNKPGAGGILGFTATANAKPDGYTLGWVNANIVKAKIVRPKMTPFDLDSFTLVANVVTDPGIISVAGSSDIKTLKDLVAAAKEKTLTISHEGVGGDDYLAVVQFENAAGITFNKVAYNGDAEAKAALLGGHIDAIEGNVSEQTELAADGQITPLVVWGSKRSAALPDVPTGKELGYDIVSASSRGLGAPAGLDAAVVTKLVDTMKAITADPEFQAELKKLNMPMDLMIGDEYTQFMSQQKAAYKALWDSNPWQ